MIVTIRARPSTLYLIPNTLYLIPYTLYLIPYTLYLIPYTLYLPPIAQIKMKKLLQFILPVSLLFNSCATNTNNNSIEKWKSEIVNTELAFCKMAEHEGVPKAFLTYAAQDVVMKRNNILIKGKQALEEYYKKNKTGSRNISLLWRPDFVDVSSSGDLGYTYGSYTYTSTDSLGISNIDEGVFHTVWKRQADGTWKFVWD
jgi:ketosteroid isomerase-like protein